jgi:ribosomal protein L11 methyltransferase
METTTPGKWLKLSINCPETVLDAASDILGVLSGSGVEQSPVEQNMSTLTAFFRLGKEASRQHILDQISAALKELFDLYNLAAPVPDCSLIDDQDWATSWQQFFKPFSLVPGLVVKPSWEKYQPRAGEKVIELDPGRAFGTGQHASTRLALQFIVDRCRHNNVKRMLDVGTGTGILAMAAALSGAETVVAVDNDTDAVHAARENITVNGLQHRITVCATGIADMNGTFDLVCANIIHDVLVDLAPALAVRLAPGGCLVLAGILRGTQQRHILEVYEQLGMRFEQSASEDEWTALLFTA